MIASNWVGSKAGLLLAHLAKVPGPGSKSRFFSSNVTQVPADERSCFATTMRAPAVPKNLILSAIFRNAGPNRTLFIGREVLLQPNLSAKKKNFTQMSTIFYEISENQKFCTFP